MDVIRQMIHPKLTSISSADIAPGEMPSDPRNCELAFQVQIAPPESDGGDTFSFTVVTAERVGLLGLPRWGRGLLIVEEFSWDQIERMLSRLIARASRETWVEVAAELSKELKWEFDGYREAAV